MLNAAIVGLGWWGKVLVQSVQQKSQKIRFSAGYVRTPSKVSDFAEEQGLAIFNSFEDILSNKKIDAVVFATPHSQHVMQIIEAAKASKHVFMEKPLTLTKEGALQAIAAVDKSNVILAVGFNRRFSPAVKALKEKIDKNSLGTLLHWEGTMCAPIGMALTSDAWRADKKETPAGGLTPMAIHIIDLMIDLFGDIDEVFCQSFRRIVPNDTDDTTSVLFKMTNGMSGYVGTLLATHPSFRLHVWGSEGSVEIRNPDMSSFLYTPNNTGQITGAAGVINTEEQEYKGFDTVRAELESFADATTGRAAYPVSTKQAVHGCSVIEAIVSSAEKGIPVKVK
ncbi:MAG: Gfo/Idh/MocA family oxidoreductase [Alphaproteobacteria bacterium]|nr:Gfo/Idh/MocA family oxidoreductase [Alphaproteobacteria bacterium]